MIDGLVVVLKAVDDEKSDLVKAIGMFDDSIVDIKVSSMMVSNLILSM